MSGNIGANPSGNKVAVARVELHNEEQLYIASATATYMVG